VADGPLGGIARAADGALAVTDVLGGRLLRVGRDGSVSEIAAGFTYPAGVALDDAGTLYVSSALSGVVDRVSAAGDVTPFLPLLAPPSTALDVEWREGALYVADNGKGIVWRTTNGSDAAIYVERLSAPVGLAFLGEDLFVSSADGNLVYRVKPPGAPRVAEGNRISWTSDDPALGSVMFGTEPGRYTRVAYPAARRWGTEHETPLLAAPGRLYYARTRATRAGGSIVASDEFRFVVPSEPPPRPRFSWTMVDVGWGDAHFIIGPEGRRILVDAGGASHAQDLTGFLDAQMEGDAVPHLDVVIATHEDADHIGGLIGDAADSTDGVLERYRVGALLMNEAPSTGPPELALVEDIAAARGIPVTRLAEGSSGADTGALDWGGGVLVTVLNSGNRAGDGGANNGSVTLRVVFGGLQIVAGGDLEAAGEEGVRQRWGALEGGGFLEADILKVNHHGYDNATGAAFLAAVRPTVALIPIASLDVACTAPDRRVLADLYALPADVYRSDFALPARSALGRAPCEDDYGHVRVVSDGESFEVELLPSETAH
jgi:beta-lactamase superfamily II metal-dependent hydrolase